MVVSAVRLRIVNILFGPPLNGCDLDAMLGLFFASEGAHIVCGGTTAQLAADFLGKPLKVDLRYPLSGLPPIGHVEGVDLVTEGVVTFKRVVEYSRTACPCSCGDGASLVWGFLSRALEVDLFVGLAENPSNAGFGIAPGYRRKLADELASNLSRLGKEVFERYF